VLTTGEAEARLTRIVQESPTIHSVLLFGSHNAVVSISRSSLNETSGAPRSRTMCWAFTVHVRTMRKRLRRSLTAVAAWCQAHRHAPVDEQKKTLNAKLRGHYQTAVDRQTLRAF
jgi:hypothetical protein